MTFGITMGDAAGVGPDILLRAFQAGELRHDVAVFGDLPVLELCRARLKLDVPLRRAASPADVAPGVLNVVDLGILKGAGLRIGEVNAESGAAAREYVVAATRAALGGEIAALVTLPMNKEAARLSDPLFTGHTELIGSLCGARDVTIMLACEQLVVTHVSTHVSLREAVARVKRPRLQRIIELTWEAAARLFERPRVAVAGLNPHAGENGLFGDEEIREIRPAVEWSRARGLPVEGPLAPDTVFYLAARRKLFDAVVCMYHDQGHVPLKLLDFEGGVNITLGLPVIRTSVDHGTAFDIAWKGTASTRSLVSALEFAARLAAAPPPRP